MRYYSDYTKQYVVDICNALNDAGFYINDMGESKRRFAYDNFETLTNFLQIYVVMPLNTFTLLNERGLVNRGKCPYTGQRIDNSFPKWTYARSRSIYVSHEGYEIMTKEDNDEYEKIMGHPKPQKKTGCYIATVCYGDEFAPEVLILKSYRDEILSKSFIGRFFIRNYYFISPVIAKHLQEKHKINYFIRKFLLDKIVQKIKTK